MNPELRPPTDFELHSLERRGFKWLGMTSTVREVTNDWLFRKNGVTYDLSAADLSQMERIEREGLFVVKS